jgi:hypothetical protein
MTAGGLCWELPTLERRTGGTGSGCVPTPTVYDSTGKGNPRKNSNGAEGGRHGVSLHHFVAMWPTPTCQMAKASGLTPEASARELMRAVARNGAPSCLASAVQGGLAMVATPTARDWRSGKASDATMERNSRPLSEQIGGSLNPTWVEWLMGWPLGWTDLKPSETDKSHCAQPQRGNY